LIDINGNTANASAVVLGDNGSIVLTNSGTLLELRSSDFSFGDDDLINIVTGRNSVIGGRGADLIKVTSGDNILFGDDAEAYFFDDGRIRLLQSINLGSGGADTIEVSNGNNKVIAGHGADKITVQAGVLFALGDEGRFEVTARVLGVANEILLQTMNTSMGGNDSLSIAGGRIVAFGGGADDTIRTIQGSTGQVIALGDGGEAILDSQERPVRISSIEPNSGGDDTIVLGNQDDIISGGLMKYENGKIKVPTGPGLGIELDRDKLAQYSELYKELGGYPYDQDPKRPGWYPIVPNDRWAPII
jgi:Ca2+-binding RTX toxin-like protein